jgi:hypothetical protein
MQRSRALGVVIVAASLAAPVAAQRTPTGTTGTAVNAHAAALADFDARVKKYVDIKGEAAKGDAKLKQSEDPAELKRRQDALAARIRGLRADAKAGDILTVETRNAFRRLLAPELKGEDGRDAKAVLKEDAPAPGAVPLKVNAKYPEGTPLPSVPATLLMNLPSLPEGVEYRIIGKDLVLLDIDAQLIVDFMRNAIP